MPWNTAARRRRGGDRGHATDRAADAAANRRPNRSPVISFPNFDCQKSRASGSSILRLRGRRYFPDDTMQVLAIKLTMKMNSAPEPEPRRFLRGSAGLIIAIAVVAMLLIWLPGYRWFFLISVVIGGAVATILYLWRKYHPIKEEDVTPKRPLGLD